MKYFLVSSPRCGSHYCGEAIALRTQVLALGECLNSMYHDSAFTFENNQVQVHWPELTQPNARNKSTVEQINKRLDNLLSAQNSWQGQAHLGHISCLGDKVIDKIVDNTHAILLYRDSYVQSIISWIIATESNVWVPREKQEYTPVYYNKEKLSSLGLSVPTNFSEFESALATANSAGELPIILGGADGWPIIHVWGLIEGAFVDPSQTRSWIFDAKGNDYATSSRIQAAEKLEEMAEAGYFGSDSLGIGYDDANAMFIDGDGLFNLTGTWMTAQLNEGMGDNVGAFAMPRSTSGVAGGGSFALPWHISSKSSNPDLAAKFLAHLMSNDFVDDLMQVGRVPAQSPTIDPTSNLQAEVISASNALVGSNAKTFYTDWATPGMYDTVTQELQRLLGGAASAKDFIDAMAAESMN